MEERSEVPLPPPLPPALPQSRRTRSRTVLWLLLLIPGAVIAVIGLVVAVGLFFLYTARSLPVTEQDRLAVLDIGELAEWMEDYSIDRSAETIEKMRYLDGSVDIDYTYDVVDDPSSPYLNCNVTVERKRSDARASYLTLWSGTQLGMSMFGEVAVEVAERNDLFRWGDESRFAILKAEGLPFGNMFITREGNRIFYVVVTGIYFDDADSIRSLLEGPLSHFRSYEP